jgi:hypothetical protein
MNPRTNLGSCEEERYLFSVPLTEPKFLGHSAHITFTIPTELSWLLATEKPLKNYKLWLF